MKHGFLQDDKGNYSIMRLLSSVVVIIGTACFVSEVIYMYFVHGYNHHLIEITAFVGLGLAAKGYQKVTENKSKIE